MIGAAVVIVLVAAIIFKIGGHKIGGQVYFLDMGVSMR